MNSGTVAARAEAFKMRKEGRYQEALIVLRKAWAIDEDAFARNAMRIDAAYAFLGLKNISRAIEIVTYVSRSKESTPQQKQVADDFLKRHAPLSQAKPKRPANRVVDFSSRQVFRAPHNPSKPGCPKCGAVEIYRDGKLAGCLGPNCETKPLKEREELAKHRQAVDLEMKKLSELERGKKAVRGEISESPESQINREEEAPVEAQSVEAGPLSARPCYFCKKLIPKARLEAMPEAQACASCTKDSESRFEAERLRLAAQECPRCFGHLSAVTGRNGPYRRCQSCNHTLW